MKFTILTLLIGACSYDTAGVPRPEAGAKHEENMRRGKLAEPQAPEPDAGVPADTPAAEPAPEPAPAVDKPPPDVYEAPAAEVPTSSCGGPAKVPCPAGHFCDPPPGMCGMLDRLGTCVPQVDDITKCPGDYIPVCGCSKGTFRNDCVRIAIGVAKDHDGPC
jgi:hypothetical protein